MTVADLVSESGADLDEVLVTLWDLGIGHVMGPDDTIARRDVKRVKIAIGVATRRQIRSPKYWATLLGMNGTEVADLLRHLEIEMSAEASRLPSGAVSKLKKYARRKGIDPLTGAIRAPKPYNREQKAQVARSHCAPSDLEWQPPGHHKELKWLCEDEIEAIHFALVRDFAVTSDPIRPPGVRSRSLLGSAVFRPQTSNDGELKYPTVESSAAALLHALIQDHPFHNGNKRTALVSMLVALDENGVFPTCSEDDLFRLVLQVAQHRIAPSANSYGLADREVLAIARWICERSRLAEKGEKPLPFRKLRKILGDYGCRFDFPGGVGNRINISRSVQRKTILGLTKRRVLTTQVFYGDEGRDVDIEVIKKIRKDLELDDLNGIDSFSFYSREPIKASDFIAKYRKTLYRLAKL